MPDVLVERVQRHVRITSSYESFDEGQPAVRVPLRCEHDRTLPTVTREKSVVLAIDSLEPIGRRSLVLSLRRDSQSTSLIQREKVDIIFVNPSSRTLA
jgi:hypothetical protein